MQQYISLGPAALACLALLCPAPALAVEGGIETYLLGSRDSLAGILPPQGTYVNNDLIFFRGSAPLASAGGAALVNPEIKVFTYKLNVTHVTGMTLGAARIGINMNVPYVAATLDVTGEAVSGEQGALSGYEYAFSDVEIGPLFGWNRGNLNALLHLQFFFPVGDYSDATVNLPSREINALNAGKNRFAFDPTLSLTWLNPDTGLELTGALGITFSARNTATDFQTAPEAHFEGTVMQHLPNRLAFGATGYVYQQIGEDSGSGTQVYKAATGAESLRAEVYGLGPIVTYTTTVGGVSVNLKAKYIREFGARRRFESDKTWITLGVVF